MIDMLQAVLELLLTAGKFVFNGFSDCEMDLGHEIWSVGDHSPNLHVKKKMSDITQKDAWAGFKRRGVEPSSRKLFLTSGSAWRGEFQSNITRPQ